MQVLPPQSQQPITQVLSIKQDEDHEHQHQSCIRQRPAQACQRSPGLIYRGELRGNHLHLLHRGLALAIGGFGCGCCHFALHHVERLACPFEHAGGPNLGSQAAQLAPDVRLIRGKLGTEHAYLIAHKQACHPQHQQRSRHHAHHRNHLGQAPALEPHDHGVEHKAQEQGQCQRHEYQSPEIQCRNDQRGDSEADEHADASDGKIERSHAREGRACTKPLGLRGGPVGLAAHARSRTGARAHALVCVHPGRWRWICGCVLFCWHRMAARRLFLVTRSHRCE